MKVPLIDLDAQYQAIKPEIDEAIRRVLESGSFILGPEVAALERDVAEYIGVQHAVGVASGTDALYLSLRALGIGQGDEVLLPAFTFFASAGAVLLSGAKPVLVDIDPLTYCIDVDRLEERITPRTKAIMPVHLFGHPAEMDTITSVAETHGLRVVEDNAQAIGAEYKAKRTGSIGDVGCLSFFPSKNLGAYGDGGMIVTDDSDLAEHVRKLRTHGWSKKYYPEFLGHNSRLDELQAAVLRVKLRHLDSWNESRRSLAHEYTRRLSGTASTTPHEADATFSVFHMYVIEVEERQRVIQDLAEAGIATGVYYPYPLHLVPAWGDFKDQAGDFPVAERAADRCLAIPLFPEMSAAHIKRVAAELARAVSANGSQSAVDIVARRDLAS